MTERNNYNYADTSQMSTVLSVTCEVKEMSGCSFITIGRTQHTYSHLDKNLSWTVQTVRASDVQYVKLNNVTLIDDTVSVSEKDETILSLHKLAKRARKRSEQIPHLTSRLLTTWPMTK